MPGNSPPRTCCSTSRAIVPPPSNATRIDCLLGRREFCHSSIIHREGSTTVRIAILEDDPDQLALLRRWLDEDGHDVHAYISGRETMKHAGRESFDLFLLDWQVPDVSGADVLMLLRANVSRSVPVRFGTIRDSEQGVVFWPELLGA